MGVKSDKLKVCWTGKQSARRRIEGPGETATGR